MEKKNRRIKVKKDSMNILIIGAHPDDSEVCTGGFATLCRKKGYGLRFMSMTNGCTGHFKIGGVELVRMRQKEAQNAASVIGAESFIMDSPNNGLEVSLPYRYRLIEIIREFKADIIISHRPNDYHPDHRNTSQLVQDTSTAINNPNVCPLTQPLAKNPTYLYVSDRFQKPYPFTPDIIFDIDSAIDTKIDMLHCHTSQFYQWLPWEQGWLDEIPDKEDEKKRWLKEWRGQQDIDIADRFRDKLVEKYGKEKGKKVKYAEAFECSEYGTVLSKKELNQIFDF